MKKSNIIIISAVLLPVCWLLLSGWLQANAFKIISSNKICSYAEVMGLEKSKLTGTFRIIKIDYLKNSVPPRFEIIYAAKQEISYSNRIKKDLSVNISGDTLYLTINYKSPQSLHFDDFIKISVPVLKGVIIHSNPNESGSYSNGQQTTIKGFIANTLSIINDCQYELQLYNNKLKKLELSGEFYNGGRAAIWDCSEYDSLDVNIHGKNGSLLLGSGNKLNPKQWISIKVPKTFQINATADILLASKISIKK